MCYGWRVRSSRCSGIAHLYWSLSGALPLVAVSVFVAVTACEKSTARRKAPKSPAPKEAQLPNSDIVGAIKPTALGKRVMTAQIDVAAVARLHPGFTIERSGAPWVDAERLTYRVHDDSGLVLEYVTSVDGAIDRIVVHSSRYEFAKGVRVGAGYIDIASVIPDLTCRRDFNGEHLRLAGGQVKTLYRAVCTTARTPALQILFPLSIEDPSDAAWAKLDDAQFVAELLANTRVTGIVWRGPAYYARARDFRLQPIRAQIPIQIHDVVFDLVAQGYETEPEINATALDVLSSEGQTWIDGGHLTKVALRERVRKATRDALALRMRAEALWPKVTDADRLTRAFAELRKQGVTAKEHFTEFRDTGESLLSKARGRGWVFFHQQNTEQARYGSLYLYFGVPDGSRAKRRQIADEVVKALRAQGLDPHWVGDVDRAIWLPVVWLKRRATRPIGSQALGDG